MKIMIDNIHNYFSELDGKYPNRHKLIHKECCKHCPTENNRKSGTTDPETEEIKLLPKKIIAKEFLFVCAWRNSKLCKGLCDHMGIDEEFIKAI